MDRARRAGWTALIVVVAGRVHRAAGGRDAASSPAAVGWPPSTLVVSEVQTGGASASDEFVEVANQGAAPVDLGGLEVVYATSSGSTVTRKATWDGARSSRPGSGSCSPTRPASTPPSPTRPTRAGSRRPAAPSRCGSSAERRSMRRLGRRDERVRRGHGGGGTAGRLEPRAARRAACAGNGTDTNDNAVGLVRPGAPSPQGLARAAGAGPDRDADARRRRADTGADARRRRRRDPDAPTPTATPVADADARRRPPTPTPTPTPSRPPTPAPDAGRRPRRPTPTPTPTPTPVADPSPDADADPGGRCRSPPRVPARRHDGDDRGRPDDAPRCPRVGRGGFVQDAIRRDRALPRCGRSPARGRRARRSSVQGTLDSRYSQRTLRVAEASIVVTGRRERLPAALAIDDRRASARRSKAGASP